MKKKWEHKGVNYKVGDPITAENLADCHRQNEQYVVYYDGKVYFMDNPPKPKKRTVLIIYNNIRIVVDVKKVNKVIVYEPKTEISTNSK